MNTAAILAGWLTDTFSTLIFGGIVTAIVAGDGASEDEIIARMNGSLGLMLSTFAVGLAFTAIGGYVAATLARGKWPVRHAAAVGLLSLLTAALFDLAGPSSAPVWLVAAGYGLTIPAALFGGWFKVAGEATPS